MGNPRAIALSFGLGCLVLFSLPALASNNAVESYITRDLRVEDVGAFSLTASMEARLKDLGIDLTTAEGRDVAFREVFSPQSIGVLTHAYDAQLITEYNNVMILGQPGVGKTHLLDQIVLAWSFGILPDYLQVDMHLSPDDLSNAESLPREILGNTHVVLINNDLLGRAPPSHSATPSQDVRMRQVLVGLFDAARREFRSSGRRTLFVLDEIALLPPLVSDTLKTLLDGTKFRPRSVRLLSGRDSGYSVLGMTTPDEWHRMVRGDGAVERRFHRVTALEPSDEATFDILRKKSDQLWGPTYNIAIEDSVIRFIIHNRRFLTQPPLASPAAPMRALNHLITWKRRHPGEDPEVLTLTDARTFFVKRSGLPDFWFPDQATATPPLQGLENVISQNFAGNAALVNQVSRVIKSWARAGMSHEVPVFLIGGPSGSGKDTFVQALSLALFGHNGAATRVNVAGSRGFSIDALIGGPPLGNHSDDRAPQLIQGLDQVHGNGMVVFNEAYDLPSAEFDKLKVLVEEGAVVPRGVDARVRPLRFPIIIMGQFGESYFGGMSAEQASQRLKDLKPSDLEMIFRQGKGGGAFGSVPQALIDRAKRTGGLYVLGPLPLEHYPDMMRPWWEKIRQQQLRSNNIVLEIDPSLDRYLIEIARHLRGPRELSGFATSLTHGLISAAMEEGFPLRDATATIAVKGSGDDAMVTLSLRSEPTPKQWTYAPAQLSTAQGCEHLWGDDRT